MGITTDELIAAARVVCSVGTSDPWNAAGIGLDVRVLERLGVRPVTVVAGVSAQGPRGIATLRAVDAAAIAAQFAALEDAPLAAYRIGALLDESGTGAVARELDRARAPAVYDPVLGASAGGVFADEPARVAIVRDLLPRCAIVTPNLAEARVLAQAPDAEPLAAARALVERGARAVLVTGIASENDIVDLLVTRTQQRSFAATRIAHELRGTGCILACGIAAGLAYGDSLEAAIASAREFVRACIVAGEPLAGMRVLRVRGRASRDS